MISTVPEFLRSYAEPVVTGVAGGLIVALIIMVAQCVVRFTEAHNQRTRLKAYVTSLEKSTFDAVYPGAPQIFGGKPDSIVGGPEDVPYWVEWTAFQRMAYIRLTTALDGIEVYLHTRGNLISKNDTSTILELVTQYRIESERQEQDRESIPAEMMKNGSVDKLMQSYGVWATAGRFFHTLREDIDWIDDPEGERWFWKATNRGYTVFLSAPTRGEYEDLVRAHPSVQ